MHITPRTFMDDQGMNHTSVDARVRVWAKAIGKKSDYTKNKGLNRNAFIGMLKDGLEQHGEMNRAELDELLLQYMPNSLSHEQKRVKLTNQLSQLRIKGIIENRGSRSSPRWALTASFRSDNEEPG